MNNIFINKRPLFTLLADIVLGFLALSITLSIRYGTFDIGYHLDQHLNLFVFVISIFIFSFYIFNLYSNRFNKNITEFNDSFIKSIIVSFLISILFFYVAGSFFNLAPKTNLVIFTVVFSVLDFYTRIVIKRQYAKYNIYKKILIINNDDNKLVPEIKNSTHAGYEIVGEYKDFDINTIKQSKPDMVIVGNVDEKILSDAYTLTQDKIYTQSIGIFYEQTFQKIPIEILDEENFINYIGTLNNIFIFSKRFIDIFVSLFFILLLLPLILLIAITIKLTSHGPILFRQVRVGLNEKLFTIYKFRSMYTDSEKDGPVWTKDDRTDNRITPIGRILRKTHLDEIPQLMNIIIGDLSFVGPRPERPEFTQIIERESPHYALRHIAKPGLTGWAQINYRYGASIDDAKEKLKYDFYYIKNKNIFLDILIIVKTFAMILKKH